MTDKKTTETMNFDADVAQLIKLVTHSIYSNTDIFLRELISNSNDACQKARLLSLQDTDYLGTETDLNITLDVDKDTKTLTITDTGIGMSREDVITHIWTIAKSGTKAFMENLQKAQKDKKDPVDWGSDLIGQFGIWFYSAFMVAKKVVLETKTNGHDAVMRSSTWDGSYEIGDSTKTIRGTSITLFLSDEDDNDAYADVFRIRWLVKKHSNYVPVPIMMPKTDGGNVTEWYEQVNAMQSIWTKQKWSVKKEEYDEFYKTTTYSQEWPLDTIHIHIEWVVNFKALLYIPKAPNMFDQMASADADYGPSLYVQNVMIMEKSKELLPVWLRFVKWVVETPDLSLNVSREILQDNKVLSKIQNTLVKEVLKSLAYIAKNEFEDYQSFYTHFGRFLKEWVHYDPTNKETLADILLYSTLQKEGLATLDSLVEKVASADEKKEPEISDTDTTPPAEKSPPLYYLTGKSLVEVRQSPYLEQFKTHDTDVILMADPLDEYVVNALQEYKWHKLTNASSPDVTLGDQKVQEEKKKETEKKSTENKKFLEAFVSNIWEAKLEKAEFTHKIGDNLAVLVTPEWQPSPQMERIMKAMWQDVPPTKRILQINAEHALVSKHMNDTPDSDFMSYVYDQAVLLEWWELEDMAWFVKRVNAMIK